VLPYLSAFIYAGIFGLSFMFTKIGLNHYSTMELISYRFLLAAIVLELLKALKLIKVNFKGKNVKLVIMTAIFEPILYFLFEVEGVRLTSTSESGLMISLIPVFTAIFAWIILREKLRFRQIIFIILSVSGVILINVFKDKVELSGNLRGIIFLLLAVISATFYNLSSKRSSRDFTPIEITYGMMWLSAIVFNFILIISKLFSGDIKSYFTPLINTQGLIPLLYLGVLSSVVAFFCVNYTISRIPVSQSAIFANLVTIVAIVAGVFILNEPFGLVDSLGAIMILVGVWGTVYFGEKHVS